MAWGDDAPLVPLQDYMKPRMMPPDAPPGAGGGPLTQPHVTVYPEPRQAAPTQAYPEPPAIVEQTESDGRNIPNYRYDPRHTASGFWQVTDTNWKHYAPGLGIDVGKYPTAMSAPRNLQSQVAGKMYAEQGFKPWAPYNPNLAKAPGWKGEMAQPEKQGWDAAPTVSSGKWKVAPEAIATEQDRPDTSVRWMRPDDYLAMTPEIDTSAPSTQRKALNRSLEAGEDLKEIPVLDVRQQGNALQVYDQDGRNRAVAAKEAGVDLIPVAIRGVKQGQDIENIQGMRGESFPFVFPNVERQVKEASPLEKFTSGVRSTLVEGPTQLAEHLLPAGVSRAINALNNWLADQGAPLGRVPEGGIDEYERRRQTELEKNKTAGSWPNTFGEIAGATIPLAAIGVGGAATLPAALARGALEGAAGAISEPVTSGDGFWWDKGGQALGGAATGAGVGAAGRAVGQAIMPTFRPAAQKLIDEGVRLTPGQMAGGVGRRVEDALGSVAFLGSAVRGGWRRAIEDFNRAAWDRVLAPLGMKLPKGMMGRQAAEYVEDVLDSGYNRVIPNLKGQADMPFLRSLQGTLADARAHLPDAQFSQFVRIVKSQLLQKVSAPADGAALKGIDSSLKSYARGYKGDPSFDNRQLGHFIQDLQTSFRSALERQNPRFSPELKRLDDAWARFVRVDRAASSLGSKDGVFMPAQLSNAVRAEDASLKKRSYGKGKALLQDLSDAAADVLPSRVPDSGTPERIATMMALGGLGHLEPHTLAGSVAVAVPYTALGMNALRSWATAMPKTRNVLAQIPRQGAPWLAPGSPYLMQQGMPTAQQGQQ
jgi:hypothetical protein